MASRQKNHMIIRPDLNLLIHSSFQPFRRQTAHNSARPPTQYVEPRLLVTSVDILNEPNQFFGTHTLCDQKAGYALAIAARKGSRDSTQ
jgi:hypothetical protein